MSGTAWAKQKLNEETAAAKEKEERKCKGARQTPPPPPEDEERKRQAEAEAAASPEEEEHKLRTSCRGLTNQQPEQVLGQRCPRRTLEPSRTGGMPRRRSDEPRNTVGSTVLWTRQHQLNVAEKVAEAVQEVQKAIECLVCMERPALTAYACGHCFCSQDDCPSTTVPRRLSLSTVELRSMCHESVHQRIKRFGLGSIESLHDVLSEFDVSDLSAAEDIRSKSSSIEAARAVIKQKEDALQEARRERDRVIAEMRQPVMRSQEQLSAAKEDRFLSTQHPRSKTIYLSI